MSYVLVNYVDVREETFIFKKVSGLTIYSILDTLACNHRHQILKKKVFMFRHYALVGCYDARQFADSI